MKLDWLDEFRRRVDDVDRNSLVILVDCTIRVDGSRLRERAFECFLSQNIDPIAKLVSQRRDDETLRSSVRLRLRVESFSAAARRVALVANSPQGSARRDGSNDVSSLVSECHAHTEQLGHESLR